MIGLYYRAPIFIQNLYISSNGLFYKLVKEGKLFRKLLKKLEESQYLSETELENLQNEKLRNLIMHCYENVPYYSHLFRQLGISPTDIKTKEDIEKLPFTTKEDVRKDPERFVSKNINRSFLKKATTSGTTGTPLRLYRDFNSIVYESATIWRQYRWAGINPGDKLVSIRGKLIQEVDNKEPPFWRYDFCLNQMLMSSYHIHETTAKNYYEAIINFNPDAIEAYPSSIYQLTKQFKMLKLEKLKVKAVFTSSETLYQYQRDIIEEFFNCKIYDLYGNAERVCALGTCEEGNYHIFSEYGICELVSAKYEGINYIEIVGTNLNNFAMPLLRYKTGDKAFVYDRNMECKCGRRLPIIKAVESQRADEVIITSDGRRLQSVEQMSEGIKHVIEFQLVQEKVDFIIIRVVATNGFSAEDEEEIVNKAKQRIGHKIDFKIEKVDNIPRTERGKYRYIINNLINKDHL
jgi:phenylacetate-CoA ligase